MSKPKPGSRRVRDAIAVFELNKGTIVFSGEEGKTTVGSKQEIIPVQRPSKDNNAYTNAELKSRKNGIGPSPSPSPTKDIALKTISTLVSRYQLDCKDSAPGSVASSLWSEAVKDSPTRQSSLSRSANSSPLKNYDDFSTVNNRTSTPTNKTTPTSYREIMPTRDRMTTPTRDQMTTPTRDQMTTPTRDQSTTPTRGFQNASTVRCTSPFQSVPIHPVNSSNISPTPAAITKSTTAKAAPVTSRVASAIRAFSFRGSSSSHTNTLHSTRSNSAASTDPNSGNNVSTTPGGSHGNTPSNSRTATPTSSSCMTTPTNSRSATPTNSSTSTASKTSLTTPTHSRTATPTKTVPWSAYRSHLRVTTPTIAATTPPVSKTTTTNSNTTTITSSSSSSLPHNVKESSPFQNPPTDSVLDLLAEAQRLVLDLYSGENVCEEEDNKETKEHKALGTSQTSTPQGLQCSLDCELRVQELFLEVGRLQRENTALKTELSEAKQSLCEEQRQLSSIFTAYSALQMHMKAVMDKTNKTKSSGDENLKVKLGTRPKTASPALVRVSSQESSV